MNKITKFILATVFGIGILFATTAFIVSDPQADFIKQNLSQTIRFTYQILKRNIQKEVHSKQRWHSN